MEPIQISILAPGTPELAICAQWRAEAFSVLGHDSDLERRALDAFVAAGSGRIALFATRSGRPAGTCLLTPQEIEPNHDVAPWLAGLYVAPACRRHGVGERLVRAVEHQARLRGHAKLFLYTSAAAAYYQRLGWSIVDRTMWKGVDTALLAVDL